MANPYKLTDIQKRQVFRSLATKSQYKTGLDFDFDKYYKSNVQVINAVRRIYEEVKDDPEKFAVNQEVLDMVEQGMKDRRDKQNQAIVPKTDDVEISEKDLVLGARNKAWVALNRKLDGVLRSNKRLKDVSFAQIGTLAGITFDKAQVAEGKATEHISMKAKIEEGMTVDQLMSQIIQHREVQTHKE